MGREGLVELAGKRQLTARLIVVMFLVQSHLEFDVVLAVRRLRHYDNGSRRTTTTTAAVTPTATSAFQFRDCGMSSDRPVRILDVSARPSPIRTPGRVKVSALVNVSADLPTGLNADVVVSKSVLGIHLKIPCYRNIGSCHYEDVCSLLEAFFPTDRHCPRVLRRHRIPCRCPFNAGLLHLTRYSFRMPRFTGFMKTLAVGEYEVLVRLYSNRDNRELACLQLRFDMKQKKRRRSSRRRRARKHLLAPSAE